MPPGKAWIKMSNQGKVEHLNPEGLHQNPAFTQAVVVTGPAKTIYIGGQNAVDANGEIVGKGDMGAQSEQAIKNVTLLLEAAGATWENVIKWTIYVVQGQPITPGFEAFQKTWGKRPNPPAITVVFVAGLGNPDFLLEIEAIAVIPE
jgi:enamine deaminase RidA (YjgF/YER057c/UK114 family)